MCLKWPSWGLWQSTSVEFISSVFFRYCFFQLFWLPCSSPALLCTLGKPKNACLSCSRLSWCKLTCTSSRSQCYSRQVGAVEKQAVFVLTAAGSLSLVTRQGETRAVAFSAASTLCSVLIRECWYHIITFLWVSSCVWIKDFFLERNTTFFTKVIGLPVIHTV